MSFARIFSWSLFLAYSAFLIAGSVVSVSSIPEVFLIINDKLIHGIEYFGLYVLAFNAFRCAGIPHLYFKSLQYSFWYALAIGFLTESLQYFVPARSGEWQDLLANLVGILLAYLLLQLTKVRKHSAEFHV